MVQKQLSGGYLFDIQGFSVHDGPGCRTLIFFKGCPLQCQWCSNPEGIHPFPEPLYKQSKCTFDKLCIEACPVQAINMEGNTLHFDRVKCSKCSTQDCITACCSSALNLGGYFISVNDLYATIQRDRQYWGEKGGITLTGGEPLYQPAFARDLLKRCYEAFIHTAVETCGLVPIDNYRESLPYLDWIFFDLKHMDPIRHKEATGHSNKMILRSAATLAREFNGRMVFRMPLIPGFNDDDKNIRETADFIKSTGRNEINLLPVHHFGREKYTLLGQTYYTATFDAVPRKSLERCKTFMESAGIICHLAGDTPF